MDIEYYVSRIKFKGAIRSVIWFTNDVDGVLLAPNTNNVIWFKAPEELLAYAESKGLEIEEESDNILFDLDATKDWLTKGGEPLGLENFYDCWNMIGDVATSRKKSWVGLDDETADLYDKLFCGIKQSAAEQGEGECLPTFMSDELDLLKHVFVDGLELIMQSFQGKAWNPNSI